MREPRNPFKMRTSEQIESEATFLSFFSPGVLDLLPKDDLWDRVQIIRSAPGGGKTSLLRVFKPSALVNLYSSRTADDYKDLYNKMKEIEAISDNGPELLGIMLSCVRNYASLEHLDFNQSHKERLLFSLLNARIILAMLRGALALKGLHYPKDLDRLHILSPDHDLPIKVPIPGSGRDLFEWAHALEKSVCETIDSFDPLSNTAIQGHDTLLAFLILKPELIICDGTPVARRILVMLDDVHKLTSSQRHQLLEALFDLRPPNGIWLAERLEALNPNELLAAGVTTGREYSEPINLEDFWRSKSNSKRFENTVLNIADRRVSTARDVQVGSFSTSLQGSLDGKEWRNSFEKAISVMKGRITEKVSDSNRFQEWLRARENSQGTPREQAISWRVLEILVERDLRKEQLTFDFALSPEDLERKEASSSAVKAAAEFFIAQEFDIPYYFSVSRVATLSSSNIEQFLAFAGDLFEEIISAGLMNGPMKSPAALEPNRQESILKKAVQQRWEEIPRRLPYGRDVQDFLKAIQEFTRWETYKPNAPYAPGVTGIGITMADRDKLFKLSSQNNEHQYERLLMVLSTCISHNMLQVSLERFQGQKGKTWMILYLNRWLCVQFGLPIGYGGWRSKTPADLSKWLDEGFRPPGRNGVVKS